jgi:peptidoglycan/LPS O-acetylase OafA/YrhL
MKRVAQLDGIRGIAILLVLVWHYLAADFLVQVGKVSIYPAYVMLFTRSGVSLFFVLSGFLIGGILLDHRQTSNYFRVFYVRRACRILPLYFLMVGSFVGIRLTSLTSLPQFDSLLGRPFPLPSYLSFTQNILMGMRGDFGPRWLDVTWSLAIEEQFYLLVPLLVYFASRRQLVVVLVAGIAIAPILRQVSPGFHAYVNTPWRADALLAGVYLALLVRSPAFLDTIRRRRRILQALLIVMLVGVTVITAELWLTGLYSAFILIAYVDTEPTLTRGLKSPVLVWFGQRSYAIYLFHSVLLGLCFSALRGSAPHLHTLADAGGKLLALAGTLLLAEVSYRFYEGPILRLGHRLQYCPTLDLGRTSP